MADNQTLPTTEEFDVATDDVGGVHFQRVKLDTGGDGASTPVDYRLASQADVQAVRDRLPATPHEQPLTDDELRAAPVPVSVSGSVEIANDTGSPVPVSGAVSVSNFPSAFGVSGAVEVTNDAGNPLPVSGAVDVSNFPSAFGVTGAVEITNDSGSPIPVSVAALPLPSGAATEATLGTLASVVRAEDSTHTTGDVGIMALAVRADNETTLSIPDGDYAPLQVNAVGRLKVSTQPGLYDLVTGTITANAQTVFCRVDRASNVMLHVVATPSFSGHNCTFEGSIDSTNGTDGAWFGIQAVRSNANTIETATGVLAATPAYAWEASVNGLSFIRVRATAHASGTATWKVQRGSYATEPIPAAQASATQAVSGTVTATLGAATTRAGFVAGSGIWFDDSSTALAGNATFTGTSRDATVALTAAAFANAATYAQEVRLSAESDVAGTLWLEVSRDNTNWRRVKSVATAAVTGGGQYAEIVHRPSWRWWRVGFTNGATVQARFSLGSIAMAV